MPVTRTLVALAAVTLRVLDPPTVIVIGFAVSATVGFGGGGAGTTVMVTCAVAVCPELPAVTV